MIRIRFTGLLAALSLLIACSPAEKEKTDTYDVIIRGGTVYDGSGTPGHIADVGIRDQRIAAIGDLKDDKAATEIDVKGLAVAPGFINMLSWAVNSLVADGRAMSDIKQGVTLEVFGEGVSMGPLNDDLKARYQARQGDIKYPITWTTLGEYLDFLVGHGIAPNVASFVGATTVRTYVVGYDDRRASTMELHEMQALVRQAMEEGALGVGSSLIYAPAFFADTDELIALASAAGEKGGMYISHMRSESGGLLTAVDELIRIAREAGVAAEIYHLKASGRPNWHLIDALFDKVNAARAAGLAISADMYTYPASATGLDAAMPLWVQEGGHDAWVARLKDPAIRARVVAEMEAGTGDARFTQIGPENILLVDFRNPALKPLTGKRLSEVATARHKGAAETAIDLVIEDNSRVGVVYFSMTEANLPKKIRQPWVSFGSDAGAPAAEGVFLKSSTHPRAYGNVARLLGRYVRQQKVITLTEAIRRLTSLPARNLKLRHRGRLAAGYFADIAIFDADTIIDRATFEKPHQYATGMVHVLVNGTPVLKDGEPTGATPGQVVRGPGWNGWQTG